MFSRRLCLVPQYSNETRTTQPRVETLYEPASALCPSLCATMAPPKPGIGSMEPLQGTRTDLGFLDSTIMEAVGALTEASSSVACPTELRELCASVLTAVGSIQDVRYHRSDFLDIAHKICDLGLVAVERTLDKEEQPSRHLKRCFQALIRLLAEIEEFACKFHGSPRGISKTRGDILRIQGYRRKLRDSFDGLSVEMQLSIYDIVEQTRIDLRTRQAEDERARATASPIPSLNPPAQTPVFSNISGQVSATIVQGNQTVVHQTYTYPPTFIHGPPGVNQCIGFNRDPSPMMEIDNGPSRALNNAENNPSAPPC
ncbi:hypothetical protein DFH07DRAFT_462339 [Mycena maculata]|uniref:Uncharacterized protein n=1 Tax=Mycena maculata TaxID=230809 RepID=A0AAD7K7Q4_9AGAR|nr:hypothetical protein DFH07DRAFT_462339 [Mycena maculata]